VGEVRKGDLGGLGDEVDGWAGRDIG